MTSASATTRAPSYRPHGGPVPVAHGAELSSGSRTHGAVLRNEQNHVRAAYLNADNEVDSVAGAYAQGKGDVPGVYEAGVQGCG